ncbi:MAG: hypothetical protein AVDCRST_MAG45-1956, partial [uncultured Solirubrobacterales bacterium]
CCGSSRPAGSSCAASAAGRGPPASGSRAARSWPCPRAISTRGSRPPRPPRARSARRPASTPSWSRSSTTFATGTAAPRVACSRSSPSSCFAIAPAACATTTTRSTAPNGSRSPRRRDGWPIPASVTSPRPHSVASGRTG